MSLILSAACRSEPPPIERGPPPTLREDVVEHLHGREVHDPYRWLERDADSEVQAWVAAQDAYARAHLGTTRHRERLREQLRAGWDREGIVGPVDKRGDRYFYARRHRGRDKPVYYVREGLRGSERVLIDPAELSPDGSLGIRSLHPSRDGRLLAYAVRRNAADAATLRVLDVDSGADLPADVIPGARFATPNWAADNRSFFYVGLPDDPSIPAAELGAHATVRRHFVGTAPARDEVLYGPTGDARSIPSPRLALGDRYLLLHLFHGAAGSSDVYVKELDGARGFRPLIVGSRATNLVFGTREQLFLMTSEGAPHQRILAVDPQRPREAWREVVPERDATLEQLAIMNGHMVLAYLDDMRPRVFVRRLGDGRSWEVALPEEGAVLGIWTDPSVDEALIGFGSLADSQASVYRVPIPAEASAMVTPELFWGPEDGGETGLVMRRHDAASPDGTSVPVFVVHREELELDGQRPTILYGYGGFGISIKPGPNAIAQLWAAQGGVWAQASLRGGGEYGEGWHRAGTKTAKQRVFDDFLASAEGLVAAGYTAPAHLGIYGGSNGGLLVGAASTQRPDLFGAVVCAVPLLDMVRYAKFGLGPLWIDEYGTVDDPEQFRALHDYSPYHQIRAGVDYPALLMMSADTDDRVDPLHARKYVAAMQHANAASRPVLLRTEAQAGHGGADSLSQAIDAYADLLAFLLAELDPGHGAG